MSGNRFTPPLQFDEFRLIRPLGEGAMGQVYLCSDASLYRDVAVKFLKGVELEPELRERFWTEARAIARVTHANIVTIYRVGQIDGVPYLASEYVEGQSLDKLSLPLPFEQVVTIALGLARALALAHRKGVLHRDIKPANVMLTKTGEVKLLDFGLAKLLDALPEGTRTLSSSVRAGRAPSNGIPNTVASLALTATASAAASLADTVPQPAGTQIGLAQTARAGDFGMDAAAPAALRHTSSNELMGTPLYMAPEVWRGERATSRSDIYSLGALLYEIASGRPPHDATDFWELRGAAINKDVPSLARKATQLPAIFVELVDRCLYRDPKRRFASGEELLSAILGFERGSSGSISLALANRRVPYLRVGAGVLGAVALVGGGLCWYNARPINGMARLDGGSFAMGAMDTEWEAAKQWCVQSLGPECDDVVLKSLDRERPMHTVTLSAYAIDRREVTTEEFVAWLNRQPNLQVEQDRYVRQDGVMLADAFPMYEPFAGFTYDKQAQKFVVPTRYRRRPATQVSWHAADRYCRAHGKRLPTEAEWEFAARGVEGRRFPWGYEPPTCKGVVLARAPGMPCAAEGAGPQEVATAVQDRTPEGIYDLGGGVAEWVADAFVDTYPACAAPCRDPLVQPTQPATPSLRSVRGGAWQWPMMVARATTRSRYAAQATPINFGFRCAAAAPKR